MPRMRVNNDEISSETAEESSATRVVLIGGLVETFSIADFPLLLLHARRFWGQETWTRRFLDHSKAFYFAT